MGLARAGIGGEAARQAGKALRANVCALAGAMLQAAPDTLDIRDGIVVDQDTGRERISLAEVARVGYFRPDTLPLEFQAELTATRHFVPRQYPFASPTACRPPISRSTPTPASSSS